MTLDCQLHLWENPTRRPWDADYPGLALYPPFTFAEGAAMLRAHHVAGALVDVLPAHRARLPDGSWDYDMSYFREAARCHPGLFAATLRLDPARPDLAERITEAAGDPEILALRMVLRFAEQVDAYRAGAYDALLAAASRHRLPVMLFATGHLDIVAEVARRWPDNWLLIDHLGMPQAPRPVDDPPFAQLDRLLDLARFPNVGVKCIGLPDFSQQHFPYADTLSAFGRIVDRFGIGRLIWGTDYTRLRHRFGYGDLVDSARDHSGLSPDELDSFMERNMRTILAWPHSSKPAVGEP